MNASSILIAATALGTGIGLGWMWWGERTEAGAPASRGISGSKAQLSDSANRAQGNTQEESKVRVVTELERMEGLTAGQFAVKMADAWMDYGDPDNHLRKIGIHEMATSAGNEENRRQFLAAGMESGSGQPPAEFVKWMAEPLESAPALRVHFERMASRWVASSPDEAMNWLAQNGLCGGGSVALSSMAATLVRTGKGAEVDAWLVANPNAPGRSAIVTGRREASSARQ